MKTLNLRSMSWVMALAMMVIVSFTGCSDDDDEVVAPVFPSDLKEVECAADATATISFEANLDWTLSSNAGWCKFVDGELSQSVMNGKAGKQTVTVKVSADGQNYTDDDAAEIKLKMGDEEKVIYKITRPKKVFNGLTIKDQEGNIYNEANPIIIKGSGIDSYDVVYTEIIAESEFEVGITESPDWITITADEMVEGTFAMTFNNANTEGLDPKYSFTTEKGYKLVFAVKVNENENLEVTVPVAYEGLEESAIALEPVYLNTLTLSADGKTFTASSMMGTGVEYEAPLTTTVTTRNDDFHVLKIGMRKKSMMGMDFITYYVDSEPDWVTVEEEGATLTLTAEALSDEDERGAAILVIPAAVWNKIKDSDNLQSELFDRNYDMGDAMDYLNEGYESYMWAKFSQEPEKEDTQLTLKGFYTDKEITDWSTVSENDLIPFDGDNAMLVEGGVSELGCPLWIASFGKDFLQDKKSVCIQTSSIPDEVTFGANNPNYEKISAKETTIDGKRYLVLTGTDDYDANATYEAISAFIGNPDMGEFLLELSIEMY